MASHLSNELRWIFWNQYSLLGKKIRTDIALSMLFKNIFGIAQLEH